MSTTTRPMTADEFLMLPDDGMRHELVRGELTTMPLPCEEHGSVTMTISALLWSHVKQSGLGKIYAAETGYLIERNPDTVRGADVGFVGSERLAQIKDRKKHIPFAPDLAVEVISPSDRPGEVAEKMRAWLAAGAAMVWNADPRTRSVKVHRPGIEPVELSGDDVLDGGDVVPGFRCRVADLFD